MRKQSRDKLLDPDHRARRPKRKRSKKITLQVRCTSGPMPRWCADGGPDKDDWYHYRSPKYATLKDARNAVESFNHGFWAQHCNCRFRINPIYLYEEQR